LIQTGSSQASGGIKIGFRSTGFTEIRFSAHFLPIIPLKANKNHFS
jgi:hypothetical protein